jgi:hypothetical protein
MGITIKKVVCPLFYLKSTLKPEEPLFLGAERVSADSHSSLREKKFGNFLGDKL